MSKFNKSSDVIVNEINISKRFLKLDANEKDEFLKQKFIFFENFGHT